MKFYTNAQYTGRIKRRKAFRLLFVVLLAVAILVSFAVLGNLFRKRLENAAHLLDFNPGEYTHEVSEDSPVFTALPRKADKPAETVCLPLPAFAYTSPEEVTRAIEALPAETAGISFTVNGHFDESTAEAAVEAAARRGMSFSVTLFSTGSGTADGAILRSLSAVGAKDVLLTGLADGDVTEGELYVLLVYLDYLRTEAPGVTLGLALPPDVFGDGASAPSLDTLASYFDYLALDFALLSEEEISKAEQDHAGSIRYYSLALLTKGDGALSATVPTLRCTH